MDVEYAQREVRTTYVGGSVGQLVSGLIWVASAVVATWGSHRAAAVLLVVGGVFIFPLTQVVLRLMGRPSSLRRGHPMNALGMQVAFVLPLSLPVVFAASIYHHAWFYPAMMVVLGAHYLPFIFMYGMWQFGVLSAVLIGAGVGIGLWAPGEFSLGAWLTAVALLGFAAVSWLVVGRESREAVGPFLVRGQV